MKFFEHTFVDMDGVLCDLIGAMLALHKRNDLRTSIAYPAFESSLGLPTYEVWAPIVQAGAQFWAGLPIFPWAHQLLHFANKISREVTILTRPLVVADCGWNYEETGACVQGKLECLREHFGNAHDVIFTAKKNVVARPGVLLIDDDEAYEAAFTAAGGHQFIWPQPYNRFRQFVGNEMKSAWDWYKELTEGVNASTK